MAKLTRRRTLSLAGAGMAALAGCSESSDDGGTDDGNDGSDGMEETIELDGDLPSYASILSERDRPTYFYGAIDVETMSTIIDDEGAEAGDEPADPLIGNPIVVALLCSFGLSQLANSRAAAAYSANDETSSGEGELVFADGVYTLVGEYDLDGLAIDLEDEGYRRETAEESYAVYTDVETGEAIGITDEVYAFSYPNPDDDEFDAVAAVERTVETASGNRSPKHATDDEFEALLRAGKSTGITLGLYTADDEFAADALADDQPEDDAEALEFEFGAFGGAFGVHQQLSVAGSDASTGAVVMHTDDDQVDVDRLESSLGTDADSLEVTRDGTTVSLEAEYGGDLA
ncbi:hypothetical protein [Natronorubrum texcoconense]|uniref:Uncharacterized protein n=1 Tax=Natronorubrum texcoconense TaxID=1095776 RepID=A0A1G8ZL10_9EURY|nr:hypothetical protein [Natronorubrum texcoconense]SDK15728.1 hypothetical protein SAMN04515672_2367 [Natronorubrum texcoconense]